MSDFMSALKAEADQANPNVSITENGAVGYETTGKKLVDLNYMLSSMRNMGETEIWQRFLEAYNEDPTLAILWLFFARDREACGERRTFRIIFGHYCRENPDVAVKLIPLIPFYGRWDDVVNLCFGEMPVPVKDKALRVVLDQIHEDVDHARAGKPISLIGKWLPSESTSSEITRAKAVELREMLGWTPKQYRKTLSRLRAYLDVVERKMSANQWGDINYEHVPSRAALNYRGAFRNHDEERYNAYLTNVKNGDAVIHSGMLFPHDIIHAYKNGFTCVKNIVDETLEAQWKALPNKVPADQSTLVVVDGSGSMGCRVGSTEITCHDVAQGLAIYFAEKLGGPYHNSFITFSSRPQYVQFADNMSLNARLRIMLKHTECSNTNIEKTFDLILDTAVKNHLRQDEIPANVLIISDMEFDQGTGTGYYGAYHVDKSLFDQIRDSWEAAGYKLPRLVYWNVCSRTGTIPVTNNDMGVALVSGFSPSIADMVMSAELDPYTCLVHKLLGGRYKMVEEVLRG